jgi:pSer/pThr/pTyr-binding forkhead associated (FHA) protein
MLAAVAPGIAASAPISSLGSGGAAAPRGAVRRCQTCGAPLPEGFSFCGQCGARFVDPPAGGQTMFLAGGAQQSRPLARLVALRPDGAPGETILLRDGETVLGREGQVAFPTDRLLSPRHATLLFRGGRLHIRDEGSLNGVFLKIAEERELRSGDVFRIGQQLLRYDDKRDVDGLVSAPPGDDTYVLGSPDLGYWGRLVQILTRSRFGNVYLLAGPEVTLGRERAQVQFPFDGFVSSTHAALVRRGDRTFLADRGSSNGTYLRVVAETALEHGALLLAGQNLLRIELLA